MGARVSVQSTCALLWMLLVSPILQYSLNLHTCACPIYPEHSRSLNILCGHLFLRFQFCEILYCVRKFQIIYISIIIQYITFTQQTRASRYICI
jgi:hypothetical protein